MSPNEDNSKYEELPHLLIAGAPGCGKVIEAIRLIKERVSNSGANNERVYVFTDYAPEDFKDLSDTEFCALGTKNDDAWYNSLDVAINLNNDSEDEKADAISRVFDTVVELYERLTNRSLKPERRLLIDEICNSIFSPFIDSMINNGVAYDPDNNPTFNDITDAINRLDTDRYHEFVVEWNFIFSVFKNQLGRRTNIKTVISTNNVCTCVLFSTMRLSYVLKIVANRALLTLAYNQMVLHYESPAKRYVYEYFIEAGSLANASFVGTLFARLYKRARMHRCVLTSVLDDKTYSDSWHDFQCVLNNTGSFMLFSMGENGKEFYSKHLNIDRILLDKLNYAPQGTYITV